MPGSGDAVYVVNGGTVTVSGLTQSCANLSGAAGGSGNLQMTGGSLGSPNNEPNEYVGTPGVGSFTQSGGINGPGNLEIGGLWNSGGTLLGGSGTYSLSGSGILYANGEGVGSYNTSGVVGSSGTGSFTQSGGTNLSLADSPSTESGEAHTTSAAGISTPLARRTSDTMARVPSTNLAERSAIAAALTLALFTSAVTIRAA